MWYIIIGVIVFIIIYKLMMKRANSSADSMDSISDDLDFEYDIDDDIYDDDDYESRVGVAPNGEELDTEFFIRRNQNEFDRKYLYPQKKLADKSHFFYGKKVVFYHLLFLGMK